MYWICEISCNQKKVKIHVKNLPHLRQKHNLCSLIPNFVASHSKYKKKTKVNRCFLRGLVFYGEKFAYLQYISFLISANEIFGPKMPKNIDGKSVNLAEIETRKTFSVMHKKLSTLLCFLLASTFNPVWDTTWYVYTVPCWRPN